MKTRSISVPALIVVLLLPVGCSGAVQRKPAWTENASVAVAGKTSELLDVAPSEVAGSGLAAANTRFAFKLFSAIATDTGTNILLSPSSASMALALTLNGAVDETFDAMAKSLEFRFCRCSKSMTLTKINRANAALIKALERPEENVEIKVANALWGRKGIKFERLFLETDKSFYGADIAYLDFRHPEAAATINSWASDKTNGRIDRIVESPIDDEAVLFLTNATYFKAPWSLQFDEKRTSDGTFVLSGGRRKTVPFMHQTGTYRHLDGDGFEAVALPYGEGRMSMYIFLPDQDSGLKTFVRSLTGEKWQEWMAAFEEQSGSIALPRFKFEYEAELADALTDLGMGGAFSEQGADFTKMVRAKGPVWIDSVKHKTFIAVDEKGTEAGATGSVEIKAKGMTAPLDSFNMVLDHPFFFAITDNTTGTILFIGMVADPGTTS